MKKFTSLLIAMLMVFTNIGGVSAKNAAPKTLVKAALKKTGNASKIQYTDTKDFNGLGASDTKKVSKMFFASDNKGVYTVAVFKCKSGKVNAIYNALKKYKRSLTKGNYYKSDYSKTQQRVLGAAVVGKKGNYAYYVAMATSAGKNNRGVAAIKRGI